MINRVISAEMANVLGVNINVINKPGGSGGSTGMNFAYNKPADGYTLIGQVWSLANLGHLRRLGPQIRQRPGSSS